MSMRFRNCVVTFLITLTVFLPLCVFSTKLNNKADDNEKGYLVENGKTMVYLGDVCEKAGIAIEWDKYGKSMVLKKGAVRIKLLAGSNEIAVNDKSMTLNGKVLLRSGRVLVPIGFPWGFLNVSANVPDNKKSLLVRKGPVVFYGDSITKGFPLNKHFLGVNLLNKGVSANKVSNALDRIGEVTGSKPDKVFIMLGTNDLWTNTDTKTTIGNYKKIITTIKSECPYADIVVQSVLPFGRKATDRNPYVKNDAVDKLNAELQNLAKRHGVSYIDIGKLYKDSEGNLSAQHSGDGVHISAGSYSLWANYIRGLL